MNKAQRKTLEDIISALEEQRGELETIAQDEEEKFNNLPENLQNSEKGTAFQEAADTINEQISALEDIINELQSLG